MSDPNLDGYYSSRNRSGNNPYLPFLFALVMGFGIILGYVVNTITIGKEKPFAGSDYSKVDDILNYIQVRYVDTVNKEQLLNKTIDQMLANLDPHSVYIPAKDLSEANESLEGNFEGIGIEFYIVQDTITVVTAISGGPAEGVGIKAGDRIVKINDTVVAGIKITETAVKKKLRGPKGTRVNVSILRADSKNLLSFTIRRDKIPLYSVDASFMLNPQTGYIRISNFSATTHEEFVEKLSELHQQGLKKLVIDLRGNPGGYLQAAVKIADEILDNEKMIVFTQGKAYDRQEYHASQPGIFEKGEVVVLIDQGSASASEILAGAIQDWDRGTIIGRTSFGKGLVQEQFPLQDKSAIRLTVARYYTPSGRCIQRSYNKGTQDYYNEIYERYMRGDFVHEDTTALIDTAVYTTLIKKRKVFGGGGIRPDVFVAADTSAENEYFFMVRNQVPEFVYHYTSQHPQLLSSFASKESFKQQYTVSDAMLKEFYEHLKKAGVKIEQEKLNKSKERIKTALTAFLAKQAWRMDGYYYIMADEDAVIKKALQTP